MDNYKHLLTVTFPELSPSLNDIYSGTEKKRVLKRYDNKTVGEIIDYWRNEAVIIIKEEMKKQQLKKVCGVFRLDIGVSPRYNNRRYDIDNYLKLPIDAFEKAGLFDNDVAVVELFAKRLPFGSGVVVSVFQIENGKIYPDKQGNEAYNVKKHISKKQIHNELAHYLKDAVMPNNFITLDNIPHLKETKGCYIEYKLNNIKAKDYICCKNSQELLQYLNNIKEKREKLIKSKCVLRVQAIKPMTYKKYCEL